MLEFVLFSEKPCRVFVDWLKDRGVVCKTEIEDDSYLILIPEDLDDDLMDDIEDKYDECMDMNQKLLDAEDSESNDDYAMSGILVTLKDGSISHADVDSELVNRVLSAISPEELGELVSAIADAVENPQPESFCQRQRKK